MRKIRTKASSDSKLVEKCEKETGKSCSYPSWRDYDDLETAVPANNTAAILVKVRKTSGVVYIHVDGTDEYKDRVGLDYKGYTVIVPWKPGLKFICYGSCRIGLVEEGEEPEEPEETEQAG
ncbi:hypothetical protein EV126DRAFT_172648 [Verticillium dahliae]|nr:hypothetical protein EV126DRAFT_172648 [Verticillium dahliae]